MLITAKRKGIVFFAIAAIFCIAAAFFAAPVKADAVTASADWATAAERMTLSEENGETVYSFTNTSGGVELVRSDYVNDGTLNTFEYDFRYDEDDGNQWWLSAALYNGNAYAGRILWRAGGSFEYHSANDKQIFGKNIGAVGKSWHHAKITIVGGVTIAVMDGETVMYYAGENGFTAPTLIPAFGTWGVKYSVKNMHFYSDDLSVSHSITYDLNGGVNAAGNPDKFYEGIETPVSAPTRTDGYYHFLGWTASDGDTPVINYVIPATATEDITLTANWEAYTPADMTSEYWVCDGNNLAGYPDWGRFTIVEYNDELVYRMPSEGTNGGANCLNYRGDEAEENNCLEYEMMATVFTYGNSRLYFADEYGNKGYQILFDSGLLQIRQPGGNGAVYASVPYSVPNDRFIKIKVIYEEDLIAVYIDEELKLWINVLPDGTPGTDRVFFWEYGLTGYVKGFTFSNVSDGAHTITYDLAGGTLEGKNPTRFYTSERTVDITYEPDRDDDYVFTGWTYAGVTEPVKNLQLSLNVDEDITLTANWEQTEIPDMTSEYWVDANAAPAWGAYSAVIRNNERVYKLPAGENGGANALKYVGDDTDFNCVEFDAKVTVNGNFGLHFGSDSFRYNVAFNGLLNSTYIARSLGNDAFTFYSTCGYKLTARTDYDHIRIIADEKLLALYVNGQLVTYTTAFENENFSLENMWLWSYWSEGYVKNINVTYATLPAFANIDYVLNGGTNGNNPAGYISGAAVSLPVNMPKKSDGLFLGWTMNDNDEPVKDFAIPAGTTGDITLTAHWKDIEVDQNWQTMLETFSVTEENGKPVYTCPRPKEGVGYIESDYRTEKDINVFETDVRYTGATDGNDTLFFGMYVISGGYRYSFIVRRNKAVQFLISNGYGADIKTVDCGVTTALREGVFMHFKMVFATDRVELYIDGDKVASAYDTDGKEITSSATCGFMNWGVIYTVKNMSFGHEHVFEFVEATPATCETEGRKAHYLCNCDEKAYRTEDEEGMLIETTLEALVIPALGHTEVIDAAVAPTCTETGLTQGKRCSVCGKILVAQKTVAATGHEWGEWVVTTPATATENGEETRTCKNDATHKETRVIPATGEQPAASNEPATSEETPAPDENKGGCGGVIGTGAALIGVITALLLVTFVKKRKE